MFTRHEKDKKRGELGFGVVDFEECSNRLINVCVWEGI